MRCTSARLRPSAQAFGSGLRLVAVRQLAVITGLLQLWVTDLAVVVGVGDLDALPALLAHFVLGQETVAIFVGFLEHGALALAVMMPALSFAGSFGKSHGRRGKRRGGKQKCDRKTLRGVHVTFFLEAGFSLFTRTDVAQTEPLRPLFFRPPLDTPPYV